MEDFRYVIQSLIFIFIIMGIFFGIPFFVFAYSDTTAHPALTSEIVNFYNLSFPRQKLTDQEKSIVMQGSIDEDEFGRWMQHFYDPVYNRGLVLGKEWQKSKDWAQSHKSQAKLDPKMFLLGAVVKPLDGSSDYSWERSIYEYAWGDKQRALKGLGHVLHLIEDATVPDHTRNDTHLPLVNPSPYEAWTAQFNAANINLDSQLSNQKPIILSSLNEYFDDLASYSNNNFFSRDTIFVTKYYDPKVKFETLEILDNGKKIIFSYRNDGVNNFKLAGRFPKFEWQKVAEDKADYFISDPDYKILKDYWSLLSKQAVMNGAGVVRLFFEEVDKEKKAKKLLAYNQSSFEKSIGAIVNFLSPTLRQAQTDPELAEDLGLPKLPLKQEEVLNTEASMVSFIQDDDLSRSDLENPITQAPIIQPAPKLSPSANLPAGQAGSGQAAPVIVNPFAFAPGGGGAPPPAIESSSQESSAPSLPEIDFSSTSLNFNSVQINQSSQLLLTIFNNGGSNLSVSEIVLNGDEASQFSIASTTLNIAAGQSQNITISFSPTASAGDKSAQILISHNATNSTTSPALILLAGTATPLPDTDAPDISYSISACDNSAASNGCLLYDGNNLAISWSSGAADIASYTIECVINDSNCDGFPITNTTSTSITTNLSATGLYNFTFRAIDNSNNASSVTKQIEINPHPVIINEVAWMGTEADANDEWIELFNTSNFNILLGDGSTTTPFWKIIATDNSPNISLNGTIASNSFFVLERTSSDDTSYAENQIFTGFINDPVGDDLTLYNPSGTAIDVTPFRVLGDIGTKNPQRKTAERINPFYTSADSTSQAYNWRTASTTGSAITDKDGTVILGTPGSQNSVYNTSWQPTYISDTAVIASNTTWSASGSPYILMSNAGQYPEVSPGVTLTIDPKVIVMAVNKYYPILNIKGALKAEGTADNNIIFTSFTDSDYGGTGGAAKGSWTRIIFTSGSSANSIKYTKFKYGGYYQEGFSSPKPVIEIASSVDLNVDYSSFENSLASVFDFSGEGFNNITIQNSTFSNNGSSADPGFAAIRTANGASPSIINNTFSNNMVLPIVISSSYPNIGTNTVLSNTVNGIWITSDSNFTANATWASTLPYILESNAGVRPIIASGATLTINPGVVLKSFNKFYEPLRINGILNWQATAENLGIITSLKDDTYGGDTNNDALASTPTIGDWQAIRFTNMAATSTLSNILLRYGNNGSEIDFSGGALLEKTNVVSEP